jgi:hypothetical protein
MYSRVSNTSKYIYDQTFIFIKATIHLLEYKADTK